MATTTKTASPNTSTLLSRLAKKIARSTPEAALGMRLRLYMALSFLADHDGIAQHEFGDALLLDRNNAVLLLNELEEAGYIERRRNPEDRRRHLVFMTEAGRVALDQACGACAETESTVLSNLSANERDTLRRLLVKALEE